jgi:predicted NBD/HSP70 family sugar kinase
MTPAQKATVGLDSSGLRRLNTSAALRAILAVDGPATLAQLVTATALSRRTLESILDELIRAGWVDELEERSSTGAAGRPSRRFEARPGNALVAALRIDTFSATALICDVLGREVGRASFVLPDYEDPARALRTGAEAVEAAVAAAGVAPEAIRGGGLASGGAIEDEAVVRHIVHAPSWSEIDARGALESHFSFPWWVDNDANLAALAERSSGIAAEQDSFVWLIVGNRTGAGIIINGEVHHGFRGSAGEIVEMSSIDTDSFAEFPIAWLTSPRSDQQNVARDTLAAARGGDAGALAEVDTFIRAITPMVVTLSWTIAPPLIVLGGGLEDGADLLLPRLSSSMRAAGAPAIPLGATALGRDAPLRGAAQLVLDRLDTELFGPLVLPARLSRR